MKILSIDPGTQYTGYGVLTLSQDKKRVAVNSHGLLKSPSLSDWRKRSRHIIIGLADLFRDNPEVGSCHGVVMEFPQFQAGSRGLSASRSDATIKLACLCGMIEQFISNEYLLSTHFVSPSAWKGQTDKKITCARCLKYHGLDFKYTGIENNIADAIMIGDWWLRIGREKNEEANRQSA